MKEELVKKAYDVAKERYAEIGIDTEAVLKQLQDFHLSLHCWQADDVVFSNVCGIILKEWKGCSKGTIAVLVVGLIVLIFSSFVPELFK